MFFQTSNMFIQKKEKLDNTRLNFKPFLHCFLTLQEETC